MTEAIVTKFRVSGMDCANCASKVENAVSRLPGVTEVGASYTAQSMTVTHIGVPLAAVRNAVKAVGYTAAAANAAPDGDSADDSFELNDCLWWKTRKAMLTWGCGLALV
ncbi:MAG: heavy-metal-associated domain-containing protein, partial [Cypionkella sp.]